MARIRTRYGLGGEGVFFFTPSGPTTVRADTIQYFERCTDEFGLRDNAFTVDRQTVSGHFVTKAVQTNLIPPEFKIARNFPLRYFTELGAVGAHLSDPSRPSNSALAVQVLKATNPSKPVMDLPVSILELRELPHILHTVGNSLIKTFAKKELNREFGLTPLMSDAIALMTMADQTAKRVKVFKDLRDGPLTRKATLYNGVVSAYPGNSVTSNSSPIQCRVGHTLDQIMTSRHVWGYTTWTPAAVFNKRNLDYSDPALEYLARRAVYGAQIGLVTAWNAIPWTWLFDWFGNVGDWLEANRHVVPATPSLPRICETITSTFNYSCSGSGNMGFAKGDLPVTGKRTTKSRALASATLPSAYLPLLDGRQVKILASLAILRM